MQIVLYFVILVVGTLLGYLGRVWMERKFAHYDGTILVMKQEDKLVYSLELDTDPENLQYEEKVVFAVSTSEESLDRD